MQNSPPRTAELGLTTPSSATAECGAAPAWWAERRRPEAATVTPGAVRCSAWLGASLLREDENRLEWVSVERVDVLLMSRDKLNELLSSAVADAEPDDFGRVSVKQTTLLKVGVLGDDGETVSAGILPNVLVGKSKQTALADVRAVGKKRCQQAGQLGRKVLIKEQLHAGRRSGGGHGLRRTQSTPECRRR